MNCDRDHIRQGAARSVALSDINVGTVAKAIEADADRPLPRLRASLRQAKAGRYARTTRVAVRPTVQPTP